MHHDIGTERFSQITQLDIPRAYPIVSHTRRTGGIHSIGELISSSKQTEKCQRETWQMFWWSSSEVGIRLHGTEMCGVMLSQETRANVQIDY